MKKRGVFFYSALMCFLHFIVSSYALANDKPMIEVGAGVSGFILPHYLGADQNSHYVLPFPYIIYRGDFFNADRSGLSGFLYNTDKLDLRMSFSGSLPVNSEDNKAREGMDNIQLMAEVGPNLEYLLFENNHQLWRFDFPVRAAFTLGSPFMHYQGWTSNPRVYHDLQWDRYNVTTTIGAVYSDRHYHGYIYDVDQADVIDGRPLYRSKTGYTASRISVSAKYHFDNVVVGANLRYYDLHQAKNIDSPLLKKKDYSSFGLFIAWIFYKSDF